MSVFDQLYNNSPPWFQNVMLSTYGIKLRYDRYWGEYHSYLKFLMKSQWYELEQFSQLQLAMLRDFISHAYNNVPYYRELFGQMGLKPEDIQTLEDIKHIPILEKKTLRLNPDSFRAQNYKHYNLVSLHTSGTTGTPMTIYTSRSCWRRRWAFVERFYQWSNLTNTNRSARFSGRIIIPPGQEDNKIFWRYNLANNQVLFSTYHMSDENVKYYVDKLKKFNPVYIDGYPSAIYILAKYLERNGAEGHITPRAILTTAETLLDYQRDVIEQVFKTKVYDQYASTEGAPFITECEYGNLHINPESGIFEFLKPDNTPADFGEMAQLCVTSFVTKAMPLIRYKIGDWAIKKAGHCGCGRKMPLVETIVGRVEDILYTKQRGYVGRLDPIFKKLPNSIVEAQIIQEDIDRITILIVPDRITFQSSHLDMLEEELKYRLGSDIHITKEIVESIPRGAAGKFKAVISKLPLTFE